MMILLQNKLKKEPKMLEQSLSLFNSVQSLVGGRLWIGVIVPGAPALFVYQLNHVQA